MNERKHCRRKELENCPYRDKDVDYSHWVFTCGMTEEEAEQRANFYCCSVPCLFAIESMYHTVEPVQEEIKQKTNSKGKRCPWDEETKQKYDGKCTMCAWDNKCVKQVEETVDSCTWPYKGV